MTRTSKALKRLGVAGLAVVTIGAGVPAFFATTASASGPVTTVTLTAPAGDQGAAGTCTPYQATVKDLSGAVVPGATVTVSITDNGATATQDVDFCQLPTNVGATTYQPQAPSSTISNAPAQTGGGGVDAATFQADANGVATFGVTAKNPGTVTVRAFYDASGDKTFSAGEPTDTRTATFTAGGPAGSNANQDAAATVTVDRNTDTAVASETRSFTVTVDNGTDALNGVTVTYSTTPPGIGQAQTFAPTSCGSTNNDGVVTCKIPFSTVGTDNITFYVNQTCGATSGPDACEPKATLTETVQAAPTAGTLGVSLACQTDATRPVNTTSPCVNGVLDTNRVFRAIVENTSSSNTTTTTGTRLAFAVSGGSGDETVAPTECTTADYTAGAGDPGTSTTNSFCDVTVNDPTPVPGEVLTLTATIRGTTASSSATLTFRNEPKDARNIALTPKTATTAPNNARTFTATVVDSLGKPVQGVAVTFTESGAGAFRNGSSTVGGTTDANGQASAEVISLPGETGSQTITVSIDNPATTQCQSTAGNGTTPGTKPAGGAVPAGQTAGNCTDTATNTFSSASPTPSQSAGGTPTLATSTPDIQPNQRGLYQATNLTAGVTYELRCYSRPSTTYFTARSITASTSTLEYGILPGTNTRCYVRPAGDETKASNSVVINVHTTLSLSAVRTGVRTYVFQGRNLPRRSGQLITLYRLSGGQEIRTSNLVTDASGIFRVTRTFSGTGTFQFRVRTSQNLTNAAGASVAITVTVH
jgi:adhesin/invasin